MIRTIRGSVAYNANENADGSFYAVFKEISARPVRVLMSSPFYRKNGGGALGIPDRGDEILAHFDESNDDIIYQSTIIKDVELEGNSLKDFKTVANSIYSTEGKPVKVTYQNHLGAGLDITRDYNVTDSKIASYVQLKSEGGKRIALDDSPEIDATIVRNQHGDGLHVQGNANKTLPNRALLVKSNGPQYYTCYEGSIEMKLVDGRDITIENNSTGANAQTPNPEFWPNGLTGQQPKRFGGVYVRSEKGDVSISSKANDGRIFIVTPKARIQIAEDGSVQIDAESDIQMRTSGDMKFKAGGDISMEGANININCEQALTVAATTQAAISSTGPFTIDGLPLDLNTIPTPASIPPIDIGDSDLNDYNE